MKWPWRKEPENRGTITFLADRIVIGTPHGVTDADVDYIRRQWEASDEHPHTIVFPWPVDVVDKR